MGAVRELPRRHHADAQTSIERRVGELRLAHFNRTRDVRERDALLIRYMPLARSLAGRFLHTSESFDDLVQVAALALLKAIERYDPARGAAFSSFAVPTILGELRRHLRDHTWSVHVPRDLQELGQRLPGATDALTLELGRLPTVAELAAALNVEETQVLDARHANAAHSPASLDEPVSVEPDAAALGDLLGAEDERLRGVEDAVLVDRYLQRLSPRSREILRLRFEHELLQREIGAIFGLSQMHVSRLIRQAIEQLRELAAAELSESLA